MVWRRVELADATTLAELHYILQICFQWDDYNLHHFRIHGKDFGIPRAGCPGFSASAHDVAITDLAFDEGDKFWYTYNYFEDWIIDIRVERLFEKPSFEPARCIQGKRMRDVTRHDECQFIEQSAQLLRKILVEKCEYTHKLRQELDEWSDLNQAIHFNRNHINQEIGELQVDFPHQA